MLALCLLFALAVPPLAGCLSTGPGAMAFGALHVGDEVTYAYEISDANGTRVTGWTQTLRIVSVEGFERADGTVVEALLVHTTATSGDWTNEAEWWIDPASLTIYARNLLCFGTSSCGNEEWDHAWRGLHWGFGASALAALGRLKTDGPSTLPMHRLGDTIQQEYRLTQTQRENSAWTGTVVVGTPGSTLRTTPDWTPTTGTLVVADGTPYPLRGRYEQVVGPALDGSFAQWTIDLHRVALVEGTEPVPRTDGPAWRPCHTPVRAPHEGLPPGLEYRVDAFNTSFQDVLDALAGSGLSFDVDEDLVSLLSMGRAARTSFITDALGTETIAGQVAWVSTADSLQDARYEKRTNRPGTPAEETAWMFEPGSARPNHLGPWADGPWVPFSDVATELATSDHGRLALVSIEAKPGPVIRDGAPEPITYVYAFVHRATDAEAVIPSLVEASAVDGCVLRSVAGGPTRAGP